MANTYLHVLYAGRGDAFIIEEEDDQNAQNNRFYLLDGGPLNRVHGGQSNAPFYHYLQSKVFQVGRTVRANSPVKPDAIFVSHWHDDHYGGLTKLFAKCVSPTWTNGATNQRPLVFNGPLFAPPFPTDDVGLGLKYLIEKLFHFAADGGQAQLAPFVLGGPGQIRTYRRIAPTVQVTWGIDDSPGNEDSLLMWHTPSGMVFTGDSMGWKIDQFMREKCKNAGSPPAFRLFKVPHHGSLRNSQLLGNKVQINDVARADYALYWALSADEIDLRPFPDWLCADPVLWKRAKLTLLAILFNDKINATQLLTQIKQRIAGFEQASNQGATNWAPVPTSNDYNTPALWLKLRQAINDDRDFHLFEEVRSSKRKLSPSGPGSSNSVVVQVQRIAHEKKERRPWTDQFIKDLNIEDFYREHIAKVQLITFYGRFSAEAYVISANWIGHNRHPAAETIAAIAIAAKYRQKPVQVFVTDADSVDLWSVRDLVIGNDWDQWVTIRYLRGFASAKLNPALDGGAMDVNHDTAVLTLDGAVDLTQLRAMFQAGPPLAQPTTQARRYRIATPPGPNRLYLEVASSGPRLVTNAVACDVADWWDTARLYVNDVRIGDATSGQSDFFSVTRRDDGFVLAYYARNSIISALANTYITTNAANSFLTTDPNDGEIAVFSFEPIVSMALVTAPGRRPNIRMGVTPSRPFRTFCTDAHIPTGAPVSADAALAAMAGPQAMAELRQQLGGVAIDRQILAWPVDLDASQATYEMAPTPQVSAADLKLAVPTDATVSVGGADLAVSGASVELAWDQKLVVTLVMQTTQGLGLTHGVTVTSADHSVSVADYLVALGIDESTARTMPAGKVLAAMVGDQPKAERLMLKLPASLLRAEAPKWQTDPTSGVTVRLSPLGRVEVSAARLVLTPPVNAALTLTVEGLSFTLSDIVLTVTDARLVQEQVALRATATLAGGVTLDAALDLTDDQGRLTLTLPKQATLADLVAIMPGRPDFGSLPMPEGGALSAITLSAPGVSVAQVNAGTENYSVASVFLTAAYDGWSSILPAGVTAPTRTAVYVEIHQPLSADRRLGFSVFIDLNAGAGKALAAVFSAQPLPGAGDYVYVLELASNPGVPVTLAEALGALSLNDRAASAIAAIPVLGDVLGNICLDYATLTVEAGAFSEFSLRLLSNKNIKLIDGVLELEGAELVLDYFNQGWSAQASASLALAGTTLSVSAELPTPSRRGAIAFANPEGLTIAGFLTAVGLPDPTGVPVIGALTAISIRQAELSLASVQAGGRTSVTVVQGNVVAVIDSLDLGPLHLSLISLEVSHTTAAGADDDNPQGTGFALEASLGADASVVLAVDYDIARRSIVGSLRIPPTATLYDLLKQIIPAGGLLDTMRDVIGALAVKDATIELDCDSNGTPRLKRLAIDISSDASLTVATLAITGIKVTYEVSTSAGVDTAKTNLAGSAAVNLGQGDFQGLKYLLDWKDGTPLVFGAAAEIAPGSTLADKARFDVSYKSELVLVSAVHVVGLSISYQPVATPKLKADVEQAWVTIPTSSTPYTPKFTGKIVLGTKVPKPGAKDPTDPKQQVDGATASLTKIADSQTGGDFLGIPRLKLAELTLEMIWAYDLQRTVKVAGKVTIGRFTLAAAVEFEDSTAKLITVSMDGGVSLADLFKDCLGLSDWGAAALPEIAFSKGRLTYRARTIGDGGSPAKFELSARMRLLLGEFDLTGTLTDGKGTTAGGTAVEPLDAIFVTITGPDMSGGPGLSLTSMQGQPRTLDLAFGLKLFGLDFSDGHLTYTPAAGGKPAIYTGRITYKGTTPLGDDPTIEVEWTQAGGFKVTKWPALPKVPDMDLVKLMGNLGDGDPCKALGALGIDKNFIKGRCRTDMRMSAGTPKQVGGTTRPTANVEMDIRYDIYIQLSNKTEVVLNPNATPLTIREVLTAPAEISVDEVLKLIADAVAGAVAGLVEAILKDPGALAQMCGAIAVQQLTNRAIDALICRKVPSEPLKNEYRNRQRNPGPDNDKNDGDDNLDKGKDALKDVVEAGTAAAAAAAAETVFVFSAAAVGFFGALLASIASLFGIESDEEKEAKRKRDEADRLRRQAEAEVRKKLAISQAHASYSGGGRVDASWSAVAGDTVTYLATFTVRDGSGVSKTLYPAGTSPLVDQRGTTATITDTSIQPGAHVTMNVSAHIPRPSGGSRYEGDPRSAELDIPDYGPKSLVVEQIGTGLAATWQAGPSAASGWSVAADAPGTLTIATNLPPQSLNWELTAGQLTTGLVYTISVTPTGMGYAVPAVTARVPLSSVSAPGNVRSFFDAAANAVTVEWDAVTGATGYRAQASLAGNRVLDQTIGLGTPTHLPFQDAAIVAGIQIRVGTLAPTVSALQPVVWSGWLPVPPSLTAPAVDALVYEAPDIVARWPAVAGATGYDAVLADAAGHALSPAAGCTVTMAPAPGAPAAEAALYPAARFTASFSDQQVVTVTARSRNANSAGAWSIAAVSEDAPSRLRIRVIPTPQHLTLVNRDATIEAGWDAVAGATDGYDVIVLSAEGAVLSPQPAVSFPSAITASIAVATLQDGRSYQVAVRSKAPRTRSLPAIATIMREPEHSGRALARQLHAQGIIAPLAAPQLRTAFPADFAEPAAMLVLLRECFPESAATPVQLAWALSAAGYAADAAAPALLAALQGTAGLGDITSALKGAYPPPSVAASIGALVAARANAPAAAAGLAADHADLIALQLGLILAMRFTASAQTPAAMAAALLAAAFPAAQTSAALRELFPLASPADLAAAAAIYPAAPAAYADTLHAQGLTGQQAASRIGRVFGTGTLAAEMLNLLSGRFPESVHTATQKAWALANAGYDAAGAGSALSQAGGLGLPDIAAALKALYPPPPIAADVAQLQAAGTPAAQAAATLRAAHQDLTALELGVVVVRNFPAVCDPTQLAGALKQAGYTAEAVSPVLSELFPLLALADIAAALRATFQP